jgi:hypothetical protein
MGDAIGMTKSGAQKLERRDDVKTLRLAQIATALGHTDATDLMAPPPDAAPTAAHTTVISVERLQLCIENAESLFTLYRAKPTGEQKARFIALFYDHVSQHPDASQAQHRQWAENVVQLFAR